MTEFNTYRNSFENARLTRSESGVLEVALHTNGSSLFTRNLAGRPKIEGERICMENPLLGAPRIHASSPSLVLMSHSGCMGHIEAHAV